MITSEQDYSVWKTPLAIQLNPYGIKYSENTEEFGSGGGT
jgi:hypothetical protein